MQLWKGFGPIVATGYLTLNWILWIGYDRLKYVSKILFESSFGILRYTFLVFKKVTSAGLNSLWQKVYRISVKILIFDDLFLKRGPVLVILVPGMIQTLGPGSFLAKKGIWGCRGHWGHRGWWGQGGCRGHRGLKNHYWGLQSHQGSWIQLYFDVLKNLNFWI